MAVEDAVERTRGLPTSAVYRRSRLTLADGAETTLHVARFGRMEVVVSVVQLDPPAQLLGWCREGRIADAMIGGFFLRPEGRPLGELRIAGHARPHVPFDPPWGAMRACVHAEQDGLVTLAPRDELSPEPSGDLLQAGPLLVAGGRSRIRPGIDPEGFSSGSSQFDSDITEGRYPRTALGVGDGELFAVVCDGRAERDQGLALAEMADVMVDLGATDAINLDGGGSASLVLGGRLRNKPREEHGIELVGGRPVSTALVFRQRPMAKA